MSPSSGVNWFILLPSCTTWRATWAGLPGSRCRWRWPPPPPTTPRWAGHQVPSRHVRDVWCRCGCGTWRGGSVWSSSPTQTHSAAASHLLATESWPGTLTASSTSGRSPSPRTISRYQMMTLFSLDRYVDIQVCPDQVLGLSHQELPPVGVPHWPHCLHWDECLQDHFGIKVHSSLLMVDNKNIV